MGTGRGVGWLPLVPDGSHQLSDAQSVRQVQGERRDPVRVLFRAAVSDVEAELFSQFLVT